MNQFGYIAPIKSKTSLFVCFERMPTYLPFSRYVIDVSMIVFGCKIYVDDIFRNFLHNSPIFGGNRSEALYISKKKKKRSPVNLKFDHKMSKV
jgi:hypothetical protein